MYHAQELDINVEGEESIGGYFRPQSEISPNRDHQAFDWFGSLQQILLSSGQKERASKMRQTVERKITGFNHSFYLARDNSFTAEISNKFDLELDLNMLFAVMKEQ